MWSSVGLITYTSSTVEMDINIVVKISDDGKRQVQVFMPEPGQYVSIQDALSICAARAFLFQTLWAFLKTYNPLGDQPLCDAIRQHLSSLESIP